MLPELGKGIDEYSEKLLKELENIRENQSKLNTITEMTSTRKRMTSSLGNTEHITWKTEQGNYPITQQKEKLF